MAGCSYLMWKSLDLPVVVMVDGCVTQEKHIVGESWRFWENDPEKLGMSGRIAV